MDKRLASPHEVELNRLILVAQSRLHAMGEGGFIRGCSLSLRERARLIQVTSLEAMAILQRVREVAYSILNGTPLVGTSEVKCADCQHHVPSLSFAEETSCIIHLSRQDKSLPRRCSHFYPLDTETAAPPPDPAA